MQRAYVDSLHPLIFLAYDSQESLCEIVALAYDSAKRSASFLAATTGDYCDFLSAQNEKPALITVVLDELRKLGIKKIELANLPAESGTLAQIRVAAREHGYYCFARPAYVCAQVLLERLEKGKDGRPIPPGLSRIARFSKKVGRDKPIHFEHNQSWDNIGPIVPQFMKAHVARFLEVGRISNYAHANRRVFLEELSKLLSSDQWLVLSRMIVGDEVAAWQYAFQFHGTWFLYQPTFDSKYEKHWPGFCLLTKVIEEAAANPAMTTIDLGLGTEAYKAKFANGGRETLFVTLHSPLLGHLRARMRYRLASAVRTYPRVERVFESLRKRTDSLFRRVQNEGAKKTASWLMKRVISLLWATDEVFFYELVGGQRLAVGGDLSLRQIDLDLLATAAILYADDEGTLAYLLRCAPRLRIKDYAGFALLNQEGHPVHFTWASPFDQFHWDELNDTLPAPSADAVVLFDSWTPACQRGRSYYGPTLTAVAARIRQQGKQVWGFSAATNAASVRGLEKMGFPRRFSIIRKKIVWWQRLTRRTCETTIKAETLEPVA